MFFSAIFVFAYFVQPLTFVCFLSSGIKKISDSKNNLTLKMSFTRTNTMTLVTLVRLIVVVCGMEESY